jgi:predicted carbohydrate-binding protein with CBM5 and CBM33 domain
VSGASPADLAVAFRSFPRRLHEALAASEGDPDRAAAARTLVPKVSQAVDDAAAALGVPSGDMASAAEAVAARIESIPADRWEVAVLEHVRRAALDAGRVIREISEV